MKIEVLKTINVDSESLKESVKEIENRLNGVYPKFIPPTSYSNKELERAYSWRGHWMNSPEHRIWVEQKFEELLRDKNYKSQYFCQDEFDRMKIRRGIEL